MTNTPYSHGEQEFSDKGHLLAQSTIYPALFDAAKEKLEFAVLPDDQARALDCEVSVDRTVRVSVNGLMAPLTFLVQERFRRPQVAFSDDVTITEWNHNSNLPSELYKIKASLFLYGKYDERRNVFTDAIVFDVPATLLHLAKGDLPFERRRNKKNQTFLCISVSHLERLKLVLLRW